MANGPTHRNGAPQGLSLALVERAFDQVPDTVFFIKDSARRYLSVNGLFASVVGFGSKREAVGRRGDELFDPETVAYHDALDVEVMQEGRTIIDRLDGLTGFKGEPAWYRFSRIPVRDDRGVIVAVMGLSRRLPSQGRGDRLYARVAEVSDVIQSRFNQPLDMDTLTDIAGVSRAQLERDFQRVFDLSPGRYQTRLKLQHAATLLGGAASIAEIALDCGYADQSAFSRRFLAETGQTPSRFRQRAQGAPEPVGPGALIYY